MLNGANSGPAADTLIETTRRLLATDCAGQFTKNVVDTMCSLKVDYRASQPVVLTPHARS